MKKTYPFLISLSTLFLFNFTARSQTVPELMYYKFDDAGTMQTNYASSPVGTTPTLVAGLPIVNNGQFGNAISGNGGPSDLNVVDNGWATSLGSGPWTISMWLSNVPATASTSYYFFGDAGSAFRCLTGGVAGSNNIMLRGNTMTDVTLASVGSAPTVIHFVHEVTPSNVIKVYKDGVLANTVAQSGTLNITGTGFKIGGYSTVSGLPTGCLMDEFRMYNRALTAAEVASTWNVPLTVIPLAVYVIDFRARKQADDIVLNWEVNDLIEVDRFVVERSADGKDFVDIEEVVTQPERAKYEFIDRHVAETDAVYYRLLVKEVSGKVYYSRVVRLSMMADDGAFTVFPNPFSEEISMSVHLPEAGIGKVSLIDVSGRRVSTVEREMVKGSNKFELTGLGELAKGVYQVLIEVDRMVFCEKVVKK